MQEARDLFSRPFNLVTASGVVYHGVEFPSGRVILDHSEEGLAVAAVSLEQLLAKPDLAGAVVVHQPNGDPR